MGTVDLTLRDKFHATRLADIIARLDVTQGELDDLMLEQLDKIADEGSQEAQAYLAELYAGGGALMGNWDVSLDETQLNPALARYWALIASAGEGFAAAFRKDPEFMPVNLARVLIKAGDDQCRLRALTLIIKVAASEDAMNGDAETFLQEYFAGFDLEAFITAYKASPAPQKPVTAAPDPQRGLF